MSSSKDTIAAIATPQGRSGIGVIRVSGKKSKHIYEAIVGKVLPTPRVAEYVCFKDTNQAVIDKGIAIYFKSPNSYTGEDIFEYHVHGNPIVLNLLLEEIVSLGARLALPGEFTERAFLNDKMDLVQAESVAALISSNSKQAARSAIQSLSGNFSKQILVLRKAVFETVTLTEATLDFPEDEEVDINFIVKTIKKALKTLDTVLDKAKSGLMLEQNPSVVIMGQPNVGKSSIINFLAGGDPAITSPTPGTTRDIIKVPILLNGTRVTLLDTAGIRASNDDIEQEGVRRAYKALASADLVLFVCDINISGDQGFLALKQGLPAAVKLLRLWNKVDLSSTYKKSGLDKDLYISAKTGFGMAPLTAEISKNLLLVNSEEDVIFARQRHIDQLYSIKQSLQKANSDIENNAGMEIVAENLRQALLGFDQLTGRVTTDDILGEIFSRFCIGK